MSFVVPSKVPAPLTNSTLHWPVGVSKIVLLGRDGVILASKDGTADTAPLLGALRALLRPQGH